ncbi:MAG TPA: bifunctional serine/threonine-protein kinase/universal stress protein [Aquabacterium sp.]|uniref:bifunctional serine/threonine-protein kinase/universal stress protein n=1 Tax=Aquabacterium sp. TaxID=1872578 RepID=UPI002E2EEFA7|nr:bifunctional serine/threonine-protein kinase/universal stress protein [Aquabacterium sp.]HEX5373136.1 bifunctional serine/threonine-protein kinase/universal stress protein [Aquabacterium sp.]
MVAKPPTTAPETPPAVPRLKLEAGEIIDRFELVERLHQGGMATLWKVRWAPGHHPEDGDLPLIMKVPRIKGGEDPATIVGFEVEQMLMPRLSGPHVPRYVARGDFTRQPYIVMEHIPGETLKPRFDRAPLPVDEVAEIGAKVAQALHALHCQHVVHLDVKPSNIMFRPTGEAVLVDFGLSRHDQLPDLLEEEFSLPMGTGPYMSPEQVQFVRNDPRSDLFALGVLMYHLATGERPFGQPNSVAGLRKRLYTEPVPPRTIVPTLPEWFQEIVLRCLEVQPDKRYQSAAQLALDLLHPDQVALTARATKTRTAGTLSKLGRWFKAVGAEPPTDASAAEQLSRSPIIMVAIGVNNNTPELDRKLLATVRRILQIETGARLACVSVMKIARVGMDKLTDGEGNSLHVKHLVAIKHWARPLQQALSMDDQRLTFHVLEAPDTAHAIVEFAAKNHVDHIVMGARGNSALRRYLGSVSAQVVAEAECSVTVVRV